MAVKDWHFLLLFFVVLFHSNYVWTSDVLTFSRHLSNDLPLVFEFNQEDPIDELKHTRSSRSIPISDNSSKIIKEITTLNASQPQLLVHWAGEGSNVIISLARNTSGVPSAVFISYDYGKSFQNKTELFKLSDQSYASIDKFHPHKLQKRYIIFVDKNASTLFITNNFGKNITRVKLYFQPRDIHTFPEDPNIFLIHDSNSTLWITRDFGQTFSIISPLVDGYDWSIKWPGTDRRSLMIRRREPDSSTLIAIDNIYQEESPTNRVILNDVEHFSVKEDFMFAVKKTKPELYIWGPGDQGFHKAIFDSNLDSLRFHIADATESRLLVVVAHTSSLSNLYVSEENHDQVYYFRLSLPHLFCYLPNTTWNDSWLSDLNENEFADVTKIQGLKGIYVASQVIPGVNSSRLNPEHLQTVITYNWGADWTPLKPPKFDHFGIPIACKESKCSLHLSQRFSQLYPVYRYAPILTSSSAPGLIMATGTVGDSLKGHAGVFLSRDAGLTWEQVLRENYLFNFGDHGGVISAIKFYKSSGETNEFLYSIDEGQTWKSFHFIDDKIRVYGLMTEPGENTTVFTIFGSYADKHRWLIVNIDVRQVFNSTCGPDDYIMWSPAVTGSRMRTACVLGRRETYQRRRLSSSCYNGKDYDRPISTENCGCDIEDFECDFGFVHLENSMECVRNRSELYDPYAIPKTCKAGDFYNRTKGYKKIVGDTCFGGSESHYLPASIPCPYNESGFFLLAAQVDKILIVNLELNETKAETLPVKDIKNVIAIDFDMNNNCLYFADIKQDKIGRQCLNSGEQGIEYLVQNDMMSVEGMAFDWISKLLYFVDGSPAKIDVIRTDINHSGRLRKTILTSDVLRKPRGIALHPVAGYMYWTDWSSSNASIGRANLDGSNVQQLFKSPDVYWPNGITVDYIAERIFWVDAHLDYIASADLHGRGFRKILTDVAHPFAVAVYKDRMYWDDWKLQSIFVADKDHGFGRQTVASKYSSLMGLKVYAHGMQVGNNSCSPGANHCSHLCFARPDGNPPVCACPNGFTYVGGKCVCPDGSEPYLNDTCPMKGNQATCGGAMFTCENDKICIPKSWTCDGEADCKDGSDEAYCNISSCAPPFFACRNGKCIPEYWKCDIDIDCDGGEDEADCNYPKCGPDEFTCNNSRCIRKKWVCDGEDDCKDNSDELKCSSKTVPDTSTKPNCTSNRYLCPDKKTCIPTSWKCDGHNDCPDGTDEKDCSKNKCQEWQFMCAISKKCIFSAWRCDGDQDCGDGDNSDEVNCTTITPSIPDHNHLNNGSFECKDWTIKCEVVDKCIPNWWKCDGVADCPNGSDEFGCPSTGSTLPPPPTHSPPIISQKCRQNQFRCNSGLCIDDAWVCDGAADCSENEDEAHCSHTGCTLQNQFKCRYSGGCVNLSMVCDGITQCPDASDEANCDNKANTTPLTPGGKSTCDRGFIPCDVTRCIPHSAVCNGHTDCVDGSDEGAFCSNSSKYYQVSYLYVDDQFRNASSLHLYWFLPESQNSPKVDFEFMPSIAMVTYNGKPQEWKNMSWTPHHMDYIFSDLLPFTSYNMTVYIRVINTTRVFAPSVYTNATTAEGVPSPVWNVTATQVSAEEAQVTWSRPHNPKGVITAYIVNMSTSEGRPYTVRVPASATSTPVVWQFNPHTKYTFWVVAVNGGGVSNSSAPVSFIGAEGITVRELRVTEVHETWAYVTWEHVDSSVQSSLRYVLQVTPVDHPPYPLLSPVHVATNSYNFTNLAPGTLYSISIRGLDKKFYSTMSTIETKTQGKPLPKVIIKDAHIVNGTNIKISWQAPTDPRAKDWSYGVYYAPQMLELISKHPIVVNATSTTISSLESCESYLVGVGLVGPLGSGPVEIMENKQFTQYDHDAPPKELNITTSRNDTTYITVSWSASCRNIANPIGYVLKIEDLILRQIVTIQLKPTNGNTFRHALHTRYGARYTIEVGTTSPNARFAGPIVHNAPPAPAPHQLQLLPNPSNNSILVYWSVHDYPNNFPTYHYEVLVSEGRTLNVDTAMIHRCSHPPLVLTPVKSGTIYTAAVRVMTSEGYPSDLSEMFSVITESSVLGTSNGTLAVVGPLVLVLIFAGAGAAVVLVRRRRQANLASRFPVFSHYNSRSPDPTATFNSNDSLEDEDSPVIRGFSDDEPLVIP